MSALIRRSGNAERCIVYKTLPLSEQELKRYSEDGTVLSSGKKNLVEKQKSLCILKKSD